MILSLKSRLIRLYRSSEGQATVLGVVFLLVFAAYLTIQAYSAKLFNEKLASDITVALYATFTLCCVISPTIVHMLLGPIKALVAGISGYAVLVIFSLCFFLSGGNTLASKWLIFAGVLNGVGSSLLWTAQGLLILQYSERGVNGGRIFGIFWAYFNISAICGGAISFFMFDEDESDNNMKEVILFATFLMFIVAGAFFCYFLLEPSEMIMSEEFDENIQLALENTFKKSKHTRSNNMKFGESIQNDICNTISSFYSKRLLCLSPLFFYTGYKQPYQLVTFGDRFFDEKTLGLEIMSFYFFDMIGGIITGNLLDGTANNEFSKHHRKSAIRCLTLFVTITMTGNLLAFMYEYQCRDPEMSPTNLTEIGCLKDIPYSDMNVLIPSFSYAVWGFTDSVVQTYCYWLLGLYFEDAATQSRAVGFYICIQSLGWTIGFLTIPSSRMKPLHQLYGTILSLLLGTLLSFFELPSKNESVSIHNENTPLLESISFSSSYTL